MDTPTRSISNYVKEKGINLAKMARDTKIPYVSLYDSLLNDKRDRDLRAGEFADICVYLSLNPANFMNDNPG